MANRNFNRYQALEKEVKTLYADVAIGASGAPTVTKALGITSVERDATGRYTVTLDDKYTRLMAASAQTLASTTEDLAWHLTAEDVAGAKTVEFVAHTAGTDTDPSNGARILFKMELKNSSVGE